MTLIALAAQSLGCHALKDGLLYVLFLLALAGFTTAFLFVANRIVSSSTDRRMGSQKRTAFSKGAHR
jgi:hypothetical protein